MSSLYVACVAPDLVPSGDVCTEGVVVASIWVAMAFATLVSAAVREAYARGQFWLGL